MNENQNIEYLGQLEQDKILDNNIFKKMENGVFVDVGAHDGLYISNTYIFEKYRNWTGICIEPLPKRYNDLLNNRKSILINAAICEKNGECDFLEIEGYSEALSGIVDNYDPRHLNRVDNELKYYGGSNKIIKVPTYTLEYLFDKHNINKINYLSIDVEGSELNVLKGINFDKVFIDVIDVEDNFPDITSKTITPFLENLGYNYKFNIKWDIIFIHKDSKFNPNNKCNNCDKFGSNKCAKCNLTKYCSKECQISDWNNHKLQCLN